MTINQVIVNAFRTLPAPFENYMITEDGQVYRKEHTTMKKYRLRQDGTQPSHEKVYEQRKVKHCINKKTGYSQVCIRKTDDPSINNYTKYIHGLVAEAFIGPRPEGYVVDHIDGNRQNNHYTNLEYVTQKENLRRAWAKKLKKEI